MVTTRPWPASNSSKSAAAPVTLFEDLEEAAPSGPLLRVRMTVAYDGTGFRGFALQPDGVKTVASVLADAVGRVLGHPARFVVAGRTDAGVHAWGNVVHFDSPLSIGELDLASLQRSLNKMLKPAIVVRDTSFAPGGFDARHSATARSYRYTFLNRDVPDPFLSHLSWQVDAELDLRSMLAACDPLLGEHDFSSFCRKAPGRRRVQCSPPLRRHMDRPRRGGIAVRRAGLIVLPTDGARARRHAR